MNDDYLCPVDGEICPVDGGICPVDGEICAGVECWYPGEFCILRQILSEDD